MVRKNTGHTFGHTQPHPLGKGHAFIQAKKREG